ncbi:MAG: helix-turn-helix domain-containing protein [Candidatus Paceibacterota bacterium]|jgi:hypothetical protein
MARHEDRSKAIELRKKGLSYSQIKRSLNISKSTLSGWLNDMPLSEKRIRELRDFSPMRIERCRNTKLKHRQERLDRVFDKVSKDIGTITQREMFLCGLFLYWGEGGKTEKYTLTFTNTDPDMVNYFMGWVQSCLHIKKDDMHIKLHLYGDMDIEKHVDFWSKKLKVNKKIFEKPYIKRSNLTGLTYKNGFGKGTCNVRIYNRDLKEYVSQALRYLSSMN